MYRNKRIDNLTCAQVGNSNSAFTTTWLTLFSHTCTSVTHTLTTIALFDEALAVLESLLSQTLLWRQQSAGWGSRWNHRNHRAVHLGPVICNMGGQEREVTTQRLLKEIMIHHNQILHNVCLRLLVGKSERRTGVIMIDNNDWKGFCLYWSWTTVNFCFNQEEI